MTDSNNSRLLSTLIALQLSVLGILIVMLFNPPLQDATATIHENRPENPFAQTKPPASPVYSQAASSELKAALREIIREELAALPVSTVGRNMPASQPDTVLSNREREEQETAAAISAAVVQQATSAGVWTQADTEALLPHVARMSDQQRLALVDQLYGAINRQEMDIQDLPPL